MVVYYSGLALLGRKYRDALHLVRHHPMETDPMETDPMETDPMETDPMETDRNTAQRIKVYCALAPCFGLAS